MGVAFVKSAYDESQLPSNITSFDTNIGLYNKFPSRVFNRLAYDQEISRFFIVSCY